MSEYALVKNELGSVTFNLIEKYLEQHPGILLAEVYYTRAGWDKFEAWTRQATEKAVKV